MIESKKSLKTLTTSSLEISGSTRVDDAGSFSHMTFGIYEQAEPYLCALAFAHTKIRQQGQ